MNLQKLDLLLLNYYFVLSADCNSYIITYIINYVNKAILFTPIKRKIFL